MGAWGNGLYSNDDAEDFLELVRAVIKLPIESDALVDLLWEEEGKDLEHETTFYLVLADQMEKRGILDAKVRDRAISILENQTDLEELRQIGQDERDLKYRKKANLKLLERLKTPHLKKARKPLAKPQPAVVKIGDYVCFPTQKGAVRDPYCPPEMEEFVADGWGLLHVHDVGWELGYLNWISIDVLKWPHEHCPTLKEAETSPPFGFGLSFGTLSRSHYKHMHMQVIGNQPPRFDAEPPGPDDRTARFVAINNYSVSNLLWYPH